MSYKLKNLSTKTGEAVVFVRYRYAAKDALISTGVSVKPTDFSTKTGKVSKRDVQYLSKQAAIGAVQQTLKGYVADTVKEGYEPTAAGVKKFYKLKEAEEKEIEASIEELNKDAPTEIARLEKQIQELEKKLSFKKSYLQKLRYIFEVEPTTTSFLADIKAFIDTNPRKLRLSTLKGYTTLISQLKGFNKNITLPTINLTTFENFQTHLAERGVKNNSVRVALTRFKSVFKHYTKQHNISSSFLSELKTIKELADDNILFLTNEEVQAIETLTDLNPYQRQIQQQFLFSCYTGLRHSDICISPGNIQGDYLVVSMQKSNKTVRIPITVKAKAILESDYFPFEKTEVSNFIKALKRLCQKLPIFHELVTKTNYINNMPFTETKEKYKLISSHTGRKTAINNWLARGVAETVVVQWTGHRNNKMLQNHYQHKQSASDREALKLLD